jgi:Uma2 family endonuclease
MEGKAQATQRKITLESLDLVSARRPEVQVFNELLVQYPRPDEPPPGQVVPDNMVVLSDQPVRATTSFNLPLESARPFWMLEYVSKHNKRKDYEDSFDKYERDLKVPYYLIFYPDTQDLTLYHHSGERYVAVPPNEQGRHAIPELTLEVALLNGWVRFWYQDQLLPLPADLQRELDEIRQQLERAKGRAERAKRRAEQEKQRAEQEKQRAEQEKQRAEQADSRAQQEKLRADEAAQRTAQEKQRADDAVRRAEAAEQLLAQLRARLDQLQSPQAPDS